MEKTTKTIYTRLHAFQAESPAITKEAKNPFYKSDYATLEGIQQAIQPLLKKHELGYYFQPTSVGLHAVVYDVDGSTIEFDYPSNFTGKPQEIGSAVTYAKRYALCAMLGLIIGGEDDDGNNANQQKSAEVKDDYYIEVSPEQAGQIIKLLTNESTKKQGYAHYKKITNKTKIDQSLYESILEALKIAYPPKEN